MIEEQPMGEKGKKGEEGQALREAAQNTDRELWRGPDDGCGDFYADSIHVTQGGGIGINCGGMVYVKTPREWHQLAALAAAPASLGTPSWVESAAIASARLDEAEWWEHLVGDDKCPPLDEEKCMYCERVAELKRAVAESRPTPQQLQTVRQPKEGQG